MVWDSLHNNFSLVSTSAIESVKDVLSDYPKERERWFEFQAERMRQRVLDWLEENGIELIE